MMSKSDHGGTHWKASDGRQVRGGLPLSGMIFCVPGQVLWYLKKRIEDAWRSYLSMLSNESKGKQVGFRRRPTTTRVA